MCNETVVPKCPSRVIINNNGSMEGLPSMETVARDGI
jgi:hypothetical protein